MIRIPRGSKDLFFLHLRIVFVFPRLRSSGLKYKETRKCLLRGYILGALMHTTDWDQPFGGNKKLM